jgi:3-hydroxyisobutyrate dehydrogenase-like beta-hydroxyacid dehydrogenase
MVRRTTSGGDAYVDAMRITLLGMGNMGRAFATRALERGHEVTVWNRSPGRTSELVASGAVEAESPKRAVREADAALVVLADDAAVLGVCLGHQGALAGLGPATVLANVSTVSPDTARRLAEAGPDGRVLDSPVMGSPAMIAAGLGRFLIGGPPPAITALDPLWTDLGAGYTHCGPVGAGATMKVISNMLLITGVAALAEAIATARRHGISDDLLRSILAESPVVSPASRVRLESLIDDGHPGWFSPVLARKDLRLAVDLAEQAGIGVRIGPAAEALLTTVIDAGGRWPYFSAVIEALR